MALSACSWTPGVKTDPMQVTVHVEARFVDETGQVYPCDAHTMDIGFYTSNQRIQEFIQETACTADNRLIGDVTLPAGVYQVRPMAYGHWFKDRYSVKVEPVYGQVIYFEFMSCDDECEDGEE